MKLLVTWKNADSAIVRENKKKVIDAFSKWGLRCTGNSLLKSEVIGIGDESDYTRIWGCLNEELLQHKFFYNCVEKCIWFDNEPKEDVVKTGMEMIKEDGLTLFE